MPRQDLIDMKLNRILRPMIKDLKRNEKAVKRIGGFTVQNLGEEVGLQEAREQNLVWASTATDTEIRARIDQLSATLTPQELACKYGNVRGLPLETVKTIAMIEDLEIAAGTHPAIKNR